MSLIIIVFFNIFGLLTLLILLFIIPWRRLILMFLLPFLFLLV